MPPFRALAKNMAPITNADESPTNRLTLLPIYLSLFIVSIWLYVAKNRLGIGCTKREQCHPPDSDFLKLSKHVTKLVKPV